MTDEDRAIIESLERENERFGKMTDDTMTDTTPKPSERIKAIFGDDIDPIKVLTEDCANDIMYDSPMDDGPSDPVTWSTIDAYAAENPSWILLDAEALQDHVDAAFYVGGWGSKEAFHFNVKLHGIWEKWHAVTANAPIDLDSLYDADPMKFDPMGDWGYWEHETEYRMDHLRETFPALTREFFRDGRQSGYLCYPVPACEVELDEAEALIELGPWLEAVVHYMEWDIAAETARMIFLDVFDDTRTNVEIELRKQVALEAVGNGETIFRAAMDRYKVVLDAMDRESECPEVYVDLDYDDAGNHKNTGTITVHACDAKATWKVGR